MAQQIGQTALERVEVLLGKRRLRKTAVHLERADRGNQHHSVGGEPSRAALDVEKFLSAEVGAEARLGDGIIRRCHRHTRGKHRIAAVRNVGKRTAVDESRRALERLHKVGCERVLEERRHRADGLEVARSDGL